MPDTADLNKKLGIKLNTLKRCMKETEMYKTEAQKQASKVATMELSEACPHDIRKQKEVLEETNRMIPDCEQRIGKAKADLTAFLSSTTITELEPSLITEAQALIA